jgi:hypothetical protein
MRNKVSALGVVMALAIITSAEPASGQSMPDAIKNALDRKYAILQQQADTERMRAETERTRAEAEANATQRQTYPRGMSNLGPPQGYAIGIDHDSLAGFDPATYRMGNGMVLQVTGLFQPDAPTICIANCP